MDGITVAQIISLMSNPDTVIVKEGERIIFAGYLGTLAHHSEEYEAIKNRAVKHIGIRTDISHKQWKERGLLSPLEPEKTPEFEFKDLQMTVYRAIEI